MNTEYIYAIKYGYENDHGPFIRDEHFISEEEALRYAKMALKANKAWTDDKTSINRMSWVQVVRKPLIDWEDVGEKIYE